MFFIAGIEKFQVFRTIAAVVKSGRTVRFFNAATGEEIGVATPSDKWDQNFNFVVDFVTNWDHKIGGLQLSTVNRCLRSFPKGLHVRINVS